MRTLVLDGLLAAFTYWLYRPVLRAPFVFDDLTILNNLHFMRRIDPLTSGPMPGFWMGALNFFRQFRTHSHGVVALVRARPLTRLSYELNVMSSGLNPYHYHVTSLGIGVAAVATFHHILLHFAGPVGAVVGALLLAAAPLATMSVAYIAGRSSLLAALFVLLSIACFLNGWWGLAGVAVVLGVLTKEEGVVAVPLLVYLHFFMGV